MQMNTVISRLINGGWWISFSWLALTLIAQLYYFAKWLADGNNPGRYEYSIASVIILIYSSPAAAALLFAGVVPGTSLSRKRRVAGIVLLLVCVAIEILFDYLQAKYR